MPSTRSFASFLLGAALLATPALAQSSTAPAAVVASDSTLVAPALSPAAETPGTAAPSRDVLVAGVRRPATVEAARVTAHAAQAARPTRNQARAMGLVGAAAFVTGIILGDDIGTIFMVGGAGVGLFGLYYWLQ